MKNQLVTITLICTGALAVAGCSGTSGVSGSALAAVPTNVISDRESARSLSVTTASQITELPKSSDSFADSVGVNTHFSYIGTPYTNNYTNVRSFLFSLHVRHLRDTLTESSWQPYYDRLNELANHGIYDDLITHVGESPSVITSYPALLPHAIESIEGPNEFDLAHDSNWVPHLRAFQQLLYRTVKNSPQTSQFPVIGPSLTSYEACMAIGSLSTSSNIGNMHDYFSSHNPGSAGWGSGFPPYGVYGSLPYNIGIVRHVFDPSPVVSTETGWDDGATYGPTSGSVSASVKARYTMRLLFEHWNANVSRTYLYELVDEGRQNFGLIDGSLRVKPVYTAIANLLQITTDPGPAVAETPLTYSMSAASNVHHTLLQKRDGSYRLMLWLEVPAVDPVLPTQSVNITLLSAFRKIVQHTWQDDGAVTSTSLKQDSGNALQLQVTDRVSELELQQ